MSSAELQDAARKLLRMLESEAETKSVTLGELWPPYYQTEARHLKSADRSEWAWRELSVLAGSDGVTLADRQALSVTSEIVEELRVQLRSTVSARHTVYSAATVNRHLIVLRRVLRWAHEQRKIPYNPLASLTMERENNIRKGFLRTEDELQRLLRHCPLVIRALVLVLWDAGMRYSEVLNLRRDQLIRKAGGGAVVELTGDQTKSGAPRRPHLTARALAALDAIPSESSDYFFVKPNGQRYSKRYLYGLFERARDMAGLTTINGDRITLHSLRHSAAYTMRVHDHAPTQLIMRQCGWTTDCFKRYGDPDQDELSQLMAMREKRLADERVPLVSKTQEFEATEDTEQTVELTEIAVDAKT